MATGGDGIRAVVLLADAAQVVQNRLYVLGGGWSVTGGEPTPFAIALHIEFPAAAAAGAHRWEVHLRAAEGAPTLGPDSPAFFGTFELSRPAGLLTEAPVDVALAINATQPTLPPGRYIWQLVVDGQSEDHWAASFLQLNGLRPT